MSLGYADIFGGGVWTVFLAFVGKSTSDRRKIDQLDSTRIKDFFASKNTIKKVRRQPKEWQKIFANHV